MKMLRLVREGAIEWLETPTGALPAGARLLPPLPDETPWLVLHGNSATIWKKQQPASERWDLPRVPFFGPASDGAHRARGDLPLPGRITQRIRRRTRHRDRKGGAGHPGEGRGRVYSRLHLHE